MPHSLSFKTILSRVREIFPNAPETYCMSIANDALVELGMYKTKHSSQKFNSVADQKFYDIGDASYSINEIKQVYFLDDNDVHKLIPRLVSGVTEIYDET